MRIARAAMLLAATLALGACGGGVDEGVVDVAFIGDPSELDVDGLRLSPAGQEVRAATAEGLVALDASGNVVPGIAERWIVTDDGLSYIFRLRNSEWPDGTRIDGDNVRGELQRIRSRLHGTSLGLDLEGIDEIRAMTGRVIEIRLKSPMPHLLQLLAQPELGLRRNGQGTGPMKVLAGGKGVTLVPLAPDLRGLPEDSEWARKTRRVHLALFSPRKAVDTFEEGEADLVLGGTLATLPMADVGALSRGTVRLDGARGLFGFQVKRARGVLSDAALREAVAMAIDRADLLAPFNIGGWTPTTRIVPIGLPGDAREREERWADLSISERQAVARQRISAWRASSGETPRIVLALPPGPGSDRLFARLADNLALVGIALERAKPGERADLELVDRVARYDGATWFLNQFNCSLTQGPCSQAADDLVTEALAVIDQGAHAALLAQAEEEMTADEFYIPIGAPIRWSLVRGDVDGFQENPWNLHPLFPLALRPI